MCGCSLLEVYPFVRTGPNHSGVSINVIFFDKGSDISSEMLHNFPHGFHLTDIDNVCGSGVLRFSHEGFLVNSRKDRYLIEFVPDLPNQIVIQDARLQVPKKRSFGWTTQKSQFEKNKKKGIVFTWYSASPRGVGRMSQPPTAASLASARS